MEWKEIGQSADMRRQRVDVVPDASTRAFTLHRQPDANRSCPLGTLADVVSVYRTNRTQWTHTVVGDPWAEWLTTTKRVTREFHAWKYIPIYSQHNIYKFSFLPRTIIDWNTLSPHPVDSPSIDTFRARITKN